MDNLISNVSLLPGSLNKWDVFNGLDDSEQKDVVLFVVWNWFQEKNALMISKKDEVFVLRYIHDDPKVVGLFGYAQPDIKVSGLPLKVEELSHKGIVLIRTGHLVGAALDLKGNLYMWGRWDCTIHKLQLVSTSLTFSEMSCGRTFLAGLTTNGEVYVWGTVEGLDGCLEGRHLPVHLQVVALSCGFDHVAMLTENGNVFTWGYGGCGQRGYVGYTNHIDHICKVKPIFSSQNCIQVVCGDLSTLCLTISGDVWACGQLPHTRSKRRFHPLINLLIPDKIIRLLVNHVMVGYWMNTYTAVSDRNLVYICGTFRGMSVFQQPELALSDWFIKGTTPKDTMIACLPQHQSTLGDDHQDNVKTSNSPNPMHAEDLSEKEHRNSNHDSSEQDSRLLSEDEGQQGIVNNSNDDCFQHESLEVIVEEEIPENHLEDHFTKLLDVHKKAVQLQLESSISETANRIFEGLTVENVSHVITQADVSSFHQLTWKCEKLLFDLVLREPCQIVSLVKSLSITASNTSARKKPSEKEHRNSNHDAPEQDSRLLSDDEGQQRIFNNSNDDCFQHESLEVVDQEEIPENHLEKHFTELLDAHKKAVQFQMDSSISDTANRIFESLTVENVSHVIAQADVSAYHQLTWKCEQFLFDLALREPSQIVSLVKSLSIIASNTSARKKTK